jgi:hypothetical protein
MSYEGYRVQVAQNPAIYVVIDNGTWWIPDMLTYSNIFGSNTDIQQLTQAQFDTIPTGGTLSSGAVIAVGSSAPNQYLVTNGQKRWISSPETKDKYDFDGTVVPVPQVIMDLIPSGPDIT